MFIYYSLIFLLVAWNILMKNLVLHFQSLAIKIEHFIHFEQQNYLRFRDLDNFCQNMNFNFQMLIKKCVHIYP